MKFTGERVIPGIDDADLFNEHQARYLFAQRYSAGKTVLDAACGSGYGSALLAENAAAIYGVDVSGEAIDHARRHYPSEKIHFSAADCLSLPFQSGYFDLVVAFEIIEHLADQEAFLRELARVLNPSGLLLVSTPNRLYYTEERGETNPFHTREFSFSELDDALRNYFPCRAILFENHIPGLLISGPSAQPSFHSGSDGIVQEKNSSAAEHEEKTAHYFVALCSQQPIDSISPLLYLPSAGNILRERELHIRRLTDYLEEAKADAEKARARMEEVTAQADEDMKRARARMEELDQLLEERTRWARELDQKLSEKNTEIVNLQAKLEKQLEERTEWARELDRQLAEKGAYLLQLQADYDNKVQWAMSTSEELGRAQADLQRLQQEFEERTAWALQLKDELEGRVGDLRALYGSRWYRLGKNLRLSPVPPSDRA